MKRRIKLEVRLDPSRPAQEQIPRVGERFGPGVVVCSFPEIADPNIIVETDAEPGVFGPLAVDYREEHTDYRPLWVVEQAPQATVGDTFPPAALRAACQDGAGVLIGVVDTGCDTGHVAFAGCDVRGEVGRDDHGHGTHVAATCASQWGIASRAALTVRAALAGGRGTESGIANAIRSVAEEGAQVINLSLGGPPSSVMDAACRYAQQRGAIVVAAAGNDGGRQVQPGSPARAADVIVLACDRQRQYASFTDGRAWQLPNRVAAYGVDIASAQSGTRDGVLVASGTSMAAPHVTGILACLRARFDRAAALQYLWDHRQPPPDVGLAALADDLAGAAPPPAEPPAGTLAAAARQTLQAVVEHLDTARYELRGRVEDLVRQLFPAERLPDWDALWTYVGEASRLTDEELRQLLEALIAAGADPTPTPTPTPPPQPPPAPAERWAHLLSDAPGLTGQQKWLPGSTGIDIFVRRGTVVRAPFSGTWQFQLVPGGPMPIGEGVLVRDDGFCARFRHIQSQANPGPVALEAPLAVVNDPSMDLLRWPAGYPTPPDGYQHLDVSLATHPTRLDPTGGAGGDVPAYGYIWGRGGVANIQVIARTPGPPEGMRPFEAAAWARWCGRPEAVLWALARRAGLTAAAARATVPT